GGLPALRPLPAQALVLAGARRGVSRVGRVHGRRPVDLRDGGRDEERLPVGVSDSLRVGFFDSETTEAGPRALNDLLRRTVLDETLGTLAERGVPVMPLKGAILCAWLYDDPAERRV